MYYKKRFALFLIVGFIILFSSKINAQNSNVDLENFQLIKQCDYLYYLSYEKDGEFLNTNLRIGADCSDPGNRRSIYFFKDGEDLAVGGLVGGKDLHTLIDGEKVKIDITNEGNTQVIFSEFQFKLSELDNAVIVSKNGDLKLEGESFGDWQEIIEERQWEELSQRWREILLKNKYIEGIDKGLRSIDILFVIFFARHYEISIIFFFTLVFWIFFLLAIYQYLQAFYLEDLAGEFFSNSGVIFLLSLIIVVGLSWLNIISGLSFIAVRLLFYNPTGYGALFEFFVFLILIVVIYAFFWIQFKIAKKIKEDKEKVKKKKLEEDVKKSAAYVEGVASGN